MPPASTAHRLMVAPFSSFLYFNFLLLFMVKSSLGKILLCFLLMLQSIWVNCVYFVGKCVLFVKTFHCHHNYKPRNLKKNDHSTWFQSGIIGKKQSGNGGTYRHDNGTDQCTLIAFAICIPHATGTTSMEETIRVPTVRDAMETVRAVRIVKRKLIFRTETPEILAAFSSNPI